MTNANIDSTVGTLRLQMKLLQIFQPIVLIASTGITTGTIL
jgi:hypothetical protein